MIQKSKFAHWLKEKVSYIIIPFITYKNEDLKECFKNYLDEQINSCCQAQVHEFDPRDHVMEEKN